ncbi:Protein F37C4.5 [Metarhizium anisopliae]|nr:Protein F37C4.5 [Metarhizium anisopliae]
METVNRVEYRVRDLNTRSVILFPKQAQVVRDMTAVNLKPGTNEVSVIGLSPTIEQDSVKVEISDSSAIITNIAVKSSPNPDTFEEIYPDLGRNQSDCDGDNESESDSDSNSGQEQSHEVSDVQRRLREIRDKLEIATERVGNVTSRLQILESYAAAQRRDASTPYLGEELETYESFRDELFFERVENEKVRSGLREQLNKLQRQEVKEKAKAQKAKEKVRQEHERKKSLKRKRDQERHEEEDRVRRERENFWPRYCYSVCITIEYDCNTQSSSRSISEADTMQTSPPTSTEAGTVAPCSTYDLVLSYVTNSAGWAPSYNLQLCTENSTAILCFKAQLINTTSETWSNCKLVLSTSHMQTTSQATFGGLDDVAPNLSSWKIKLVTKWLEEKENRMLTSREESTHYADWVASKKSNVVNKPRGEMFINTGLYNNGLSDFEESSMAEIGFDTSYDLPGLKTLAPQFTSFKHRVDRLTFSNVMFGRVAVAKYRPVVYLDAEIKNTSKMSLLGGLAGLSLDGRFMGRKVLPSLIAGGVFILKLGVDPAIKIFYSRPEAAISNIAIDRKEIYARSITVQNTRASGGAVSIVVRDQIPVSQDDRLRVTLLSTEATHINSTAVLVGEPGQDALPGGDWGKATATCGKTGEVNWQVCLQADKAVRLTLEYSLSFPRGETSIQC